MSARTRAVGISTTSVLAVALWSGTAFGAVSPEPTATDADETAPGLGAPATTVTTDAAYGEPYGGNPEVEASLVALEERRLVDVDLVASGILVPLLDRTRPFRVSGSTVSTLVLTARETPYRLSELTSLAPQSVAITGDSVRINENIAVLPGATLAIGGGEINEVQLASQEVGFVSIVAMGGSLVLSGASTQPLTIRSWDAPRSDYDYTTADGRAYVRAIGGQVSITNVQFEHLGFWSGYTGGLSLTGTDEPFGLGPVATVGEADTPIVEVSGEPEEIEPSAAPLVEAETPLANEEVDSTTLIPMGVTAYLSDVTTVGNAFGIFVAKAESVDIEHSRVMGSLVDGIVFHREVLRSAVTSTESSNNARDGIRISRGSNTVELDTVTALENGRNGVTIDGAPLADGPSAVGLSTAPYGDHSVRDSVFGGNLHAGIEVVGGFNVRLVDNEVHRSRFGVIVRDGSQGVVLVDNEIELSELHGIALRDGVTGEISDNAIDGAVTGIYLRDSAAPIVGNNVAEVTSHAVTVIGAAHGTVVDDNTLSGGGGSAIDRSRAEGVEVPRTNDLSGWEQRSWMEALRSALSSPLSLMWIALGVILLFTAVLRFGRRGPGEQSPYKDRRPLQDISGGAVDPADVPGAVGPYVPRVGAENPSRTKKSDAEVPRERKKLPEPVGSVLDEAQRESDPLVARRDEHSDRNEAPTVAGSRA